MLCPLALLDLHSVLLRLFFNDPATTEIYTSFPTRRSSDLSRRLECTGGQLCASLLTRQVMWMARQQRSEEHTSELQSPYDLVCRLLLEKKKSRHIAASPLTCWKRRTRPTSRGMTRHPMRCT